MIISVSVLHRKDICIHSPAPAISYTLSCVTGISYNVTGGGPSIMNKNKIELDNSTITD